MRVLLLFVFTLLLSPGFTQPSNTPLSAKKLQGLTDDYLEQYHQLEHISAITLTATSEGNSTTVNSGYIDVSNKQKMNTSHLYQIGSITKSFISATLLQLVSTLSLDLFLAHIQSLCPFDRMF